MSTVGLRTLPQTGCHLSSRKNDVRQLTTGIKYKRKICFRLFLHFSLLVKLGHDDCPLAGPVALNDLR